MRRISLVLIAVLVVLALAALPGGAAPPTGGPPGLLPRSPPPTTCDPIDTSHCLLPFPDNYFTRADATSPTGLRLNLPVDGMPVNAQGVHIDPTDWNQSDGFSPGSEIIAFIPGLDLHATGAASITDIARSLDENAPIVLLDTGTGARVPYWAELDTWDPNPATKALVIRPARNFAEGHRIVVALRNLKDASGNVIPASPEFSVFRDHRPDMDTAVFARRQSINRVFSDLEPAGVRRQSLNLAWDFTVASEQGLAGRMLHMRDDAYTQLGAGVPAFHVNTVEVNPNANILKRVRGT